MPTAVDLTGQTRRRDDPPKYVLRRGLLFRAGAYQDKRFSMTTPELLRAVSLFRPVPIKVEHLDIAIFGDKLGRCRRVWTDPSGTELYGEVSLLDDLSKILPDPLPVSACFDRRTKLISELSLTLNPRVTDAAVSAVFSRLRSSTVPMTTTPQRASSGPATTHASANPRMDNGDQAEAVAHGRALLDRLAADAEAALEDAKSDPMYSSEYVDALQGVLDAINTASAKLGFQDDDDDQATERTTVDPVNGNGGGGSEFNRGRAKFSGMSAARRQQLLSRTTLGAAVLRREQAR